MSRELLFFMSALGVFNCLLLVAYLLTLQHTIRAQKWLIALLVALSIRISKSVWFYFNPDVSLQILQIGLSACFFIGPLLYFYTAASYGRLHQQFIPWTLHLLALVVIAVIVGFMYPYVNYPELWQSSLYVAINLLWGVYIAMAIPYVWHDVQSLLTSTKALSKDTFLTLNIVAGIGIIWLVFFTSSYTSYIMGAVSFSFVLYVSVLVWLMKTKNSSSASYVDKTFDESLVADVSAKLNTVMTEQKLYLNANLTLATLARHVNLSASQLSQLLNDNMHKSFTHYVNEWRISEAKNLLETSPRLNMELVAEQSGFNTQSTFYSAFKQFENTTPGNYKKRHQQIL